MGNTLHGYITGKFLKKTSKLRNKTDSTKKCHNRGLNPEHKVAREIGPLYNGARLFSYRGLLNIRRLKMFLNLYGKSKTEAMVTRCSNGPEKALTKFFSESRHLRTTVSILYPDDWSLLENA